MTSWLSSFPLASPPVEFLISQMPLLPEPEMSDYLSMPKLPVLAVVFHDLSTLINVVAAVVHSIIQEVESAEIVDWTTLPASPHP